AGSGARSGAGSRVPTQGRPVLRVGPATAFLVKGSSIPWRGRTPWRGRQLRGGAVNSKEGCGPTSPPARMCRPRSLVPLRTRRTLLQGGSGASAIVGIGTSLPPLPSRPRLRRLLLLHLMGADHADHAVRLEIGA